MSLQPELRAAEDRNIRLGWVMALAMFALAILLQVSGC